MCKGRRGLTIKRRPGKPPIPKKRIFHDIGSVLKEREKEKNGKKERGN